MMATNNPSTTATAKALEMLDHTFSNAYVAVGAAGIFIMLGLPSILLIGAYSIALIVLMLIFAISVYIFVNIVGVAMVLYMFCNIFTYVITKYCYVTDENIDERIEDTLIDDDDQPIKLLFLSGQKIGKIILDNKMMKFFTILCRSLWKYSSDHARAPTILHAFLQVHKQNYLFSYESFDEIIQPALKFILTKVPLHTLYVLDDRCQTPIFLLIDFYHSREMGSFDDYDEIKEVFELILKRTNNYTLTVSDSDGWLPLHHACRREKFSPCILQLLIEGYPEAMALKTNDGEFPFDVAQGDYNRWYIHNQIVERYVPKVAKQNTIPDDVAAHILGFARADWGHV